MFIIYPDLCSVPGTCGKGARCKVVQSKFTCECLPGHRGNPFVECAIGKFASFEISEILY